MTAELRDSDLKRDAGARRRLLEEQRNTLSLKLPVYGSLPPPLPELRCIVKQRIKFAGRNIRDG